MESNKVIWDLSSERPRTCIVVRNDIDFFCISEFLTQDLVVVQLYFPGETPTAPPEAVGNLVEYCRRNKLPLIMGCDANAHHTEWCSTDCNTQGEPLIEFIASMNLSIANVGCEPTFLTSVKREVLDITLSNGSMAGLISQ